MDFRKEILFAPARITSLQKPAMAAKPQTRYGIGEWYGNDFAGLQPSAMRQLAAAKAADKHCRFRNGPCNKKGGVCSLRLFERRGEEVSPVGGLLGIEYPLILSQWAL
jgi:hypothetical protein